MPCLVKVNHSQFRTWPYSSFKDFTIGKDRPWLVPQPILEYFSTAQTYEQFVSDYERLQRQNDALKQELKEESLY